MGIDKLPRSADEWKQLTREEEGGGGGGEEEERGDPKGEDGNNDNSNSNTKEREGNGNNGNTRNDNSMRCCENGGARLLAAGLSARSTEEGVFLLDTLARVGRARGGAVGRVCAETIFGVGLVERETRAALFKAAAASLGVLVEERREYVGLVVRLVGGSLRAGVGAEAAGYLLGQLGLETWEPGAAEVELAGRLLMCSAEGVEHRVGREIFRRVGWRRSGATGPGEGSGGRALEISRGAAQVVLGGWRAFREQQQRSGLFTPRWTRDAVEWCYGQLLRFLYFPCCVGDRDSDSSSIWATVKGRYASSGGVECGVGDMSAVAAAAEHAEGICGGSVGRWKTEAPLVFGALMLYPKWAGADVWSGEAPSVVPLLRVLDLPALACVLDQLLPVVVIAAAATTATADTNGSKGRGEGKFGCGVGSPSCVATPQLKEVVAPLTKVSPGGVTAIFNALGVDNRNSNSSSNSSSSAGTPTDVLSIIAVRHIQRHAKYRETAEVLGSFWLSLAGKWLPGAGNGAGAGPSWGESGDDQRLADAVLRAWFCCVSQELPAVWASRAVEDAQRQRLRGTEGSLLPSSPIVTSWTGAVKSRALADAPFLSFTMLCTETHSLAVGGGLTGSSRKT